MHTKAIIMYAHRERVCTESCIWEKKKKNSAAFGKEPEKCLDPTDLIMIYIIYNIHAARSSSSPVSVALSLSLLVCIKHVKIHKSETRKISFLISFFIVTRKISFSSHFSSFLIV